MKTAELKQTLLTNDGRGYEAKLAALNKLELDAFKAGERLNKERDMTLLQYNKLCSELLSNGGKITPIIWEAIIDCQQNWAKLQAILNDINNRTELP
jgi:hypothetical protein